MKEFKQCYRIIFVQEWSPYIGAVLLSVIVLVLMSTGFFWGVFGGLRLWGNYLNQWIGLGSVLGVQDDLPSPFIHHISLLDINLLFGAFTATLLSGQFSIQRAPKLEYVSAAFGGSLMGIGASLAGGCTIGGFFTPVTFFSAAGWAMWLGLLVGTYLGLKLLLWTTQHITWGRASPPAPRTLAWKLHTPMGLGIIALMLIWALLWSFSEDTKLAVRGVLIPSGFALGFVLTRSRLCFSRVFHGPFISGDTTMAKAMILALVLLIPAVSLLLQARVLDPYLAIPATFWLGSLCGGLTFGFGMVFTGGCASGSLWRMGAGHVKLMVAVFFFGWIGSIASGLFKQTGLTEKSLNLDLLQQTTLGIQNYLPDLFQGWAWAYTVSVTMIVIWYLLIRYNETTEKFSLV